VGGFLGAGKTTLILAAARILASRGLKCAAILNDQGGDLVDSAYVESQGVSAGEVGGGCFCCRFSELMSVAEQLRALSPDVIFAEPVGSCTDLSATILQPIKREFSEHFRLAPLTVVIDPARAHDIDDPNIGFLFERQLAEADLIVFNKCDRPTQFPALGATEVRYLSALSGDGVAAWLDEILGGLLPVGGKVLEIDYGQYARAEAALGWLNWSATLQLSPALSAAALVGPWVDLLQQSLSSAGACIAHLKVFDRTPNTYLRVATTSNSDEPAVDGDLTASPEAEHSLRLNLRAVMDAAALRDLFARSLASLPGERSGERLQCFSPAAPKPEHRYAEVGRTTSFSANLNP
jgi:Ni2+-binding GTPase involved in maturation of urease and hydrogenase